MGLTSSSGMARDKLAGFDGGNAAYTSYHNGLSDSLMAPVFNSPLVLFNRHSDISEILNKHY